MAVSLKHTFTSPKADGGDATLVQPSNWNAEHTLTLGTGKLLGRTTAGTGAAEEIGVAGGLTLSAGTLTGTSGTVTSVAALTIGTTGTDLSSSVANGTTTPVITLNVPTASATNRGALSSTDWSTFNNKQAALVSGTNIKTVNGTSLLGSGDLGTIGVAYGGTGATTLTSGYLLKGNGTSAVSASVIYDNGTNVGVGVVPGSWGAAYRAVQFGIGSSLAGGTSLYDFTELSSNTVAGASETYIGSTFASKYRQYQGQHQWFNAPSGTAGGVIAFTQVMTLDASGNLGIGTTTAYGGRLNAVPATTPTTIAGANQIQVGEASSNTAYRLQLGYYNDPTNGYQSSIQSYAGGAAAVLILNGAGGNVGIGTTTASAKLDVVATGLVAKFGSTSALNAYAGWQYNSTTLGYVGNGAGVAAGAAATDFAIGSTGSRPLVFGTNDTERARIHASGGVSINNTTDPGAGNLSVTGQVSASAGIAVRVTAATTVTSPLAWNSDSNDQYAYSALANALTINADAGSPANGEKMIFRFKDNGTVRVLTFTGGVTKGFRPIGVTMTASGSNWTYTTTASKTVYFGCIYNAADSRWDIIAISQEA